MVNTQILSTSSWVTPSPAGEQLSLLVWLFLKFLTGKMGKMKGELAGVSQCGANKKSMVFPAHAANVLQGTGWDTHIHTRTREGVTGKMCHLLAGWFSLLTSSSTHNAQTHQACPIQPNTGSRTKRVCKSWLKRQLILISNPIWTDKVSHKVQPGLILVWAGILSLSQGFGLKFYLHQQ